MIPEWVELISALEQEKIWPEATVEEREILVRLMLLANTEERQWEYCGKLFTIRSGQLVISYNSLPSIWDRYARWKTSVNHKKVCHVRFFDRGINQ